MIPPLPYPKKGHTAKYCKWCKAVNGSFMTHDTAECHRFKKDGSPKDRLVEPFDSIKKPWKKTGGRESSQMAYLMERLMKLEKKHTKSK
jgi:L-2-hydroxyglutarate oxidase LhgO